MSDPFLVINVRLPQRMFHGRGPSGEPEWPPSPARLFQALVAAAGEGRTDQQATALEWLECQNPPLIDTPARFEGSVRRTYVPNNDADQHGGEAGRMLKSVRPSHLPDDDTIRYVWSIAHEDRDRAATIAALSSKLRALGWGIDMAIGRGTVVDALHDSASNTTRWLPQPGVNQLGGPHLPVATVGTLAALDSDHDARMSRIQGDTQVLTDRSAPFDRVTYRTEQDMPIRPMRAFTLMNRDGRAASFWPSMTRDLTAMLRHQAHEVAKLADWPADDIEGYVCGHGNDGAPPPKQRLTYLALPSIGHRHSDGFIRNLAIAEAVGGDGRRLGDLTERLFGRQLIDQDGQSRATLMPIDESDKVTWRYHRQDRLIWASVTPVVFPGFNSTGTRNLQQIRVAPSTPISTLSGAARKTHKLILKMLAVADIPVHLIREIRLQKAPLWPNLPDVYKFEVHRYLQDRPRFHARLSFKHPVHGPITLGAGRFVGLGVFAAVQ